MNKKELKQLALEDLKRSGLDAKDFTKMKLICCDEDEAAAILNSNFSTLGYALPYFDYKGKVTESVRFRFLDELRNQKNKIVKYSQPKGTEPRLYFPPNMNWKKILKDPSIAITFTEGEKKAYAACKAGIPTIGLGGVWSFKSKKLNKALIDDFKSIVFKGRTIYICFDNDAKTNEDVMKAIRAFALELNNQEAKVFNKPLPFNPYKKIGLDDYLLDKTKKDYDKIKVESFENIEALNELDSEVAYIEEVGKFYIFNAKLFVSDSTLVKATFANRTVLDDGKRISIAAQWITSINRRSHKRLTYKPAQPKITEDNEFNLWEGWAHEPVKGSVKPFMSAVKKIFNNDKKLITWFLNWVAYPIQNPATKMLSAVLLQSIYQGTGKSSLGLCVGAMYGNNFGVITDKQLHAPFNEWSINKQFILGDEVSGKDSRSDSDFIKNIVTQEDIWINKKYAPTYKIPDCINYLLTSNHVDAWFLEPDDRRAFVHSIKKENGLTLKEGIALEAFRKGKGTSHLLHYFAYEHKISKGFDHRARPPMTQAKSDLIDHSLTDIERWLTHVKDNPDYSLSIDGAKIDRDLFTTTQVINLYQRLNPKANVSNTAMGKALNKVYGDIAITIINTSQGTQRVRALRNLDKWDKASHKEKQEHFDKSKIALFDATKKRKFKGDIK